ncbi:MAG: ATP synthase gamma chain [Candidatus Giovannonibacteria bacterium GW2011_GWA2_53_7]|uniref:ATP synthase gamma chain n=1 Tax=Candidatus Giovannonibacteria bacterium GW2011_GWA2_53_7 TaxID=1618650 RepID=A0A0G1XVF8_9BACT|nr:MAG: ATP synthase gamma chain [Candidatus Giovannonibacteria bacterium GW2011_GWA2_53_7]
MAVPTRIIKQRIRSVKNTKKITKAMELVAASKMRKATSMVVGTRPFARLAWETIQKIGGHVDTSLHSLLKAHDGATKTLYIVFTSDRGLCGGYNTRILKECFANMKEQSEGLEIVTIGRRAELAMKRAGLSTIASFVDVTNNPVFKEIQPVARMAIDAFKKGEYARVVVAYTDFISALTQKPRVFTLLPLSQEATGLGTVQSSEIGVQSDRDLTSTNSEQRTPNFQYKFEPSSERVLDAMLPRIIETMIWQALLEASASEHSARMMAMRSASDAATEMIDDLTLSFNQARQAGITQEIAEISSGAAALQ